MRDREVIITKNANNTGLYFVHIVSNDYDSDYEKFFLTPEETRRLYQALAKAQGL